MKGFSTELKAMTKRMMYEARVRFGTRVRVRVRDSTIFEKGGCGCGCGTKQILKKVGAGAGLNN